MNLQVGQIFKKNGKDFCLIELLSYENTEYALFLIEDGKINYKFYAILSDESGYNLVEINNDELNNKLFSIVEEKMNNE